MRTALICAMLATAAGACSNDAPLGPSEDLDRFMRVTLSANTLPADGISRLTIVIELDKETDPDKRTLTLTTTAGRLIAAGKTDTTVTVQADATGKATAELRSDQVPAVAKVDVSVGSLLTRTNTVEFVAVPSSSVFDVEVTGASLPADGFSTTRIAVTLKKLGNLEDRIVKFSTSAGTILVGGRASTTAADVTADSDGRAVIELQSEKRLISARVTITAQGATRNLDIPFTAVMPSDVVTIGASPGSVAADGQTAITVTATVAAGLPSGSRDVTFRTTLGQFLPERDSTATRSADGSNLTRINLVSTTPGDTRITATVDGTTADTGATFVPALPDRVFVSVTEATLQENGSTSVRAELLRTRGTPSPKGTVRYTAVKSDKTSIGTFSKVTLGDPSNGDIVSTAEFNVGETTYRGPVTIRATAEGGASGTATVTIVP
jgi:hypothetical protein